MIIEVKVYVIAEGGRTPTKDTLTRLKEAEFKGVEIDIYAGFLYNRPSYLADCLEQPDTESVIAYVNADNFFELFGGDYIAEFVAALRDADTDTTSYDICTNFVQNLATA